MVFAYCLAPLQYIVWNFGKGAMFPSTSYFKDTGLHK